MSNLFMAIGYGALRMAYWGKAATYAVAAGGVDVQDLLSGDGAAGDGKALANVNEQVKEYGKGGFTIIQNVAIYVVAIMLIGGAIALAVHAGNANKRDEDKTALIWRFLAGVLVFAGIAILVFAQKIGSMLFQ